MRGREQEEAEAGRGVQGAILPSIAAKCQDVPSLVHDCSPSFELAYLINKDTLKKRPLHCPLLACCSIKDTPKLGQKNTCTKVWEVFPLHFTSFTYFLRDVHRGGGADRVRSFAVGADAAAAVPSVVARRTHRMELHAISLRSWCDFPLKHSDVLFGSLECRVFPKNPVKTIRAILMNLPIISTCARKAL